MGKKISLIFVIGILFIFQSLSAQDWSTTIRLTWNSGSSREPVIAIGTDDSVHVVWHDETPGNWEIYHRKSTDEGTTWSTSKRLTWSSSNSMQPTISVDPSNVIHVIWQDNTPGNYELFYKKSTDGGTSWSASKRLTWTYETTYQPQIAIDSSHTIHVICIQDVFAYDEIFHKRSTDGGATWTTLKRLTWTSDFSLLPSLAIAPDDSLHVAWRDSKSGNWEIYYKNSTTGGTNWSGTKRLTWTPTPSTSPDIAVDLSNKIHVVWTDSSPGKVEIFYRSSTDGGTNWSGAKRQTWTWSVSESPCIKVSPDDVIHLTWNNYVSSTNSEIFYKSSTNGGVTWSSTERLTWNSRWSGLAEVAADSSSNIHLVWHESISNNYEIFYKNRK
jgi:hypothetical protein